MKKIMLTILLIMLFPLVTLADNSECVLRNTSSKSSFVPNEIITVEYGLARMPSSHFGHKISFIIGYNTDLYEVIKQDGKLSGINNKWENFETEIYDPGFGDESYEYIKITASTDNPEYFLLEGTIYEEPYIIGNIKLKVKEKAISDLTKIFLLEGTDEEESSWFYQYSGTVEGTDEEGNEIIVPNTDKLISFPCQQKEVSTKIVNKEDDAYLTKLTLTIETDTKIVKEITDFTESNIEVELPNGTKKVTIETTCSGKNCKVDSIKEFNMEGESTYPIVVTSDHSTRTYHLIFSQEETFEGEISNTNETSNTSTTNKDDAFEEKIDKMETTGKYTYIILIVLAIVVVGVAIFIYIKNKNKEIVVNKDDNTGE